MLNVRRLLTGTPALALLGMLAAPYGAAAQTGTTTYQVTVTNINSGMQGLSPLLLATHPASVHAWQMGQMASKGLELLAEEGLPDMLASEVSGSATDVATTHAHLLPGDSITVTIKAKPGDVLSAGTMLIQTNDGFTGLEGVALTDGNMETVAYDAGTEENTEAKADVPGPPFGGKNHGPDTTPHQPISMHQGITGKADVTPDFNWSGPVARFTIHAMPNADVVPNVPTYDVTVTNINSGMQGLSPLLVATHPASAHAWQMGQTASKGLELLAEEGIPTMLEAELTGVATNVGATNAHLLPGDSITVRVTANPGDLLSAGTMLIQTNDGFTGLDSVALTDGDQDTMAYDAGTEDNTEAKADVPGPPFGGKNHGPNTTPRQPIAPHGGITGKADVTPEFNWSGPVARFSIRTVSTGGTTPAIAGGTTAGNTRSATPGMPQTGSADNSIWLVAVLSAALVLSGLSLRRITAAQRQ